MSSPVDGGPRVLVLGSGSAGSRHARCLLEAGASVSVADPDRNRAAAVGFAPAVPFDLEVDVLSGYEGVVVASPSAAHMEQVVAAVEAGCHVLVEKPLGLDDQDLGPILGRGDGRVMVGYNLRLYEPVQRLVAHLKSGRIGALRSARLWFGSWLPDWRPTVDYRTTYSANRSLGGGVLLDAIHELDLLVWLLGDGDLDVVGAVVERLGPLEIDVEDTVKALLRHPSGVVADLSLDYLSRRYRRGMELIGDEGTLRLDWARQVIEMEDREHVVSEAADTPLIESYRAQAERFVAFLREESEPPVDAKTGAASVLLAGRIRAAGSVPA